MVTLADLKEALKALLSPADVTNPTELMGALGGWGTVSSPTYWSGGWFAGISRVDGVIQTVGPEIYLDSGYPDSNFTFKVATGFPQIRTKRDLAYGNFNFMAQIPPWTDPSWAGIWIGGEVSPASVGGLAAFVFIRGADRIETYLTAASTVGAYETRIRVDNVLTGVTRLTDPGNAGYITKANNMFVVKVNRSSIEYWFDYPAGASGGIRLLGIIQFSTQSDDYLVRAGDPYILRQMKGSVPTHLTGLIEMQCPAGYDGHKPGFNFYGFGISDGDPAPPRTLHPYTGGVKWEGVTNVNPNITSDGIPIAGYKHKTIYFLATGAGTLGISMDYGDNAYDSITPTALVVTANQLVSYPTENDGLWLRLIYTPTVAGVGNITRARVMMSD